MTRRRVNQATNIDRRCLLAMAGGALAVPAFSSLPVRAQARVVAETKVGSIGVTIISDGTFDLPPSFVLPGRDQQQIQAAFKAADDTFSGFNAEVNVAVIKSGNEIIVVDTGAGPDFVPTLGKLAERLDSAGIKPESVTKVVFTHAHADHLWGVIDPLSGESLFEKAEHLMSAAERDFWIKDDVAASVPEALRGMATGTNRRLKTISARLKTVAAGSEIVSGVSAIDTAGHTPGHISLLVKSGSEQLMIGGDVLSQSVISFAEPGWRWGPDMDPEKAVAARRRTLDQLATEKTRLLGYHLPWPGLGRVERAGNAFRFVTEA